METKIYYSVQNGGDGSAYPKFMESQELADWDQEQMDEGWGENCSGSITIESDSPIKIKEEITTKESYLLDLIEYNNRTKEAKEFFKEFFSEVPVFTVVEDTNYSSEKYSRFIFLVGEKECSYTYQAKGNSAESIQEELNKKVQELM